MQPNRIQRKRVKGWRKPEGTIYIGRGSGWGNPYIIVCIDEKWQLYTGKYTIFRDGTKEGTTQHALELFEEYALKRMKRDKTWLAPLKGKTLMCWCEKDAPCHGDILLRLANK